MATTEAPAVETKTDDDKGGELIAGKFKTQEDLIEAYQASERKISEQGEDNARWRDTVEQLFADKTPEGDSRARETPVPEDESYTPRFLENPKEGLREFGEELATHIYGRVNEMIDTRDTIREYITNNEVIRVNPRLFAIHLQGTKGKLSERLTAALEAYTGEIKAIQEKAAQEKQGADEFSESEKKKAADIGAGGKEALPAKTPGDDEKDETFDDYMKERRESSSKIVGLI